MSVFTLADYGQRMVETQGQSGNGTIDSLRHKAAGDFGGQGMPTAKTEDWKYTNLRGLLQESFVEATDAPLVKVPDNLADNTVVMVNGCMNAELSRLDNLSKDLRLISLSKALTESDELPDAFGRIVRHEKHPFAALNSAGFNDGLLIDVKPGAAIETPLILTWLTGGKEQAMIQPRLFIRLGQGAQLTLIEQHIGNPGTHLINQVSEIEIDSGARLTHVQIQATISNRLIHGVHVRCGRDSYYRCQSLDYASALVRNDLVVSLAGKGAEADVDGLFTAREGEHVDNHIRIDHKEPQCRSQALYKGLLGRDGHGVFNGKLVVHPGADKTDARQTNHNLLLADKVEINTKPELEIYTDDVKCSHGTTTGALDQEQFFYLLSRGINKQEARQLLVAAFAGEIRQRLPVSGYEALLDIPLERALEGLANQQEPQ